MQGIYKIRNKVNGKYYVGSSVNVEDRWVGHRRALDSCGHRNIYLQRAWNQYSEDNFEFVLTEEIKDVDNLRPTEQKYLDEGFEEGILYNVARVATASMQGRRHTQAAREKMSKALIGRKFSEEHKAKLGKAFLGRKCSVETRAKISLARKKYYESHDGYWLGKRRSEEMVSKWHAGYAKYYEVHGHPMSGRSHTQETKVKMSMARRIWWQEHDYRHTAETRAKISLANKGRKPTPEARRKMAAAKAKPYPAFYNIKTEEYISAGRNLKKMCQLRGLNYDNMFNLKRGYSCCSRNGWRIADE